MTDRSIRKGKGYANKVNKDGVFLGCERNHTRHPAHGISWCKLCARENRVEARNYVFEEK